MGRITQEQLQAIIQYAAGRIGVSPEQLAQSVQNQNIDGLAQKLSPDSAAKLQELVKDRGQVEQLLSSPEIQQLLKKINGQ